VGRAGIRESHDDLKRLEAEGKGDTGLAADDRRNERIDAAKIGALVVIVGGVVAFLLLR
jgi:hypothetical protein